MDWIEIKIETGSEGVEPITGLVLMAGIPGLVVDDPKDLKNYLESPQAARWDYVEDSLLENPDRLTVIRVYVADNEQGRRQWAALSSDLAALKAADQEGLYGDLSWSLANVKEEDWANNWKAYFKPFTVGQRLVIKPTWESWDQQEGQIILEIDPGSSFGTGQHHTTRLCLELLEKQVQPGMKVLDLGCGSGILMIAALLLGAGQAIGVDVEENAVRTAKENLKQNRISPGKYALHCGDLTADQEFLEDLGGKTQAADMITANIVADVILAMTPYFTGFLKPAGKLLVSGIIDERRQEVLATVEQAGFTLLESGRSGEWNAFVFEKIK